MHDCYRAGLAWLSSSGIQTESGGVSRYFQADLGRYKSLSTEITAYGALAYLHLPLPGHTGLLSNALRAGQFLCYDTVETGGDLFPVEVVSGGSENSCLAYFFDCGIIIRALVALWNSTSDPMYLERAERCGAALLQRMSRVDGAFFPMLDLQTGAPSVSPENWSREPGPYQLKVGMGFLELAEVTSSGMFSKVAEQLLRWSMRHHEVFLPGHAETDRVVDRMHAYCYFLEGLLPFVEHQYECAQVLQAGVTRIERMLEETRSVLERCDVIAQLLRLRLLSDYIGIVEIDMSAASREAEALPGFQIRSDDRRTNGAFCFARREGELLPHANPAATIFALQALRMWNEYQRGELRTTWHDLI